MAKHPVLFLMCVALATSGCLTVTRRPVAFSATSGPVSSRVEYVESGWVTGRSCEEYAEVSQVGGELLTLRLSPRERPAQSGQR